MLQVNCYFTEKSNFVNDSVIWPIDFWFVATNIRKKISKRFRRFLYERSYHAIEFNFSKFNDYENYETNQIQSSTAYSRLTGELKKLKIIFKGRSCQQHQYLISKRDWIGLLSWRCLARRKMRNFGNRIRDKKPPVALPTHLSGSSSNLSWRRFVTLPDFSG